MNGIKRSVEAQVPVYEEVTAVPFQIIVVPTMEHFKN